MARILVADDEVGVRSFMEEALDVDGHTVTCVVDGPSAIEKLKAGKFDLFITDLHMPGTDGLSIVKEALAAQPGLQVITMTAFGSVDTAVEAMKLGAADYLQKPISGPVELRALVARATRPREEDLPPPTPMWRLSWGAQSMGPVIRAIDRVAATNATVLLQGESGSGKEVAARTLHDLSNRRGHPFVAINCAGLTPELLSSELFGHERGAFTGAAERKRGRLELADKGTFFMDEVGELQLDLQSKLLRVLEERRFSRVGGTTTIDVDVRWIAATNRDLRAMVERGTFREDLYHRLAVFPIRIPPLRERRSDIRPLTRVLLHRIGKELGRPGLKLDEPAIARIEGLPWRGNVRELRNALERAAILAEGTTIAVEHLHVEDDAPQAAAPVAAPSDAGPQTLADMERNAILAALHAVDGHRQKAAQRLGIGLRTLYEKLKRYELT